MAVRSVGSRYQGYRPQRAATAAGVQPRNQTTDPQGNRYSIYGASFPDANSQGAYIGNINNVAGATGMTPQQMGGIAANWGQSAPLYMGQFASDARATGEAQGNTDRAVQTLGNSYDDYLKRFDAGKTAALATQQQAIAGYMGSQTQKALQTYVDPKYQAVSDEFVGTQRGLANRAISKQQADATAAGVAMAGQRGYQGSSLAPSFQAAAGYRGAGDRAAVASQLATDQLDANNRHRQWAVGQMSTRDSETARLQGNLASEQGRTAVANPYAGQMASLQNERPVYMPDFTQVPTQVERDRFLDSLGMSQEQALSSLQSTQQFYQQMVQNAQTAEEKAQATEALNAASLIISFLNLTPQKLLGMVGLGG